MEVLQNTQKFRVLWHGLTELRSAGKVQKMLYPYPGCCGTGRTELRSSGYGNESLTELPEVPGIVARAYRT